MADPNLQTRGEGTGGGGSHPDPELSGGQGGVVLKKIFSALWAWVWSKTNGGDDGSPGLLPWIRQCMYPFLFENGRSRLLFGLPSTRENGNRKRIFSKTFSRVGIFENAGFSFTCGRTKMEVFEYDDVIPHIYFFPARRIFSEGCYRISITLAFKCGWAKATRIRYMWMRIFFFLLFFKTEKKSPFSKIFGYVWRGPNSTRDGDLNDWVWGDESLDGIGVFLI